MRIPRASPCRSPNALSAAACASPPNADIGDPWAKNTAGFRIDTLSSPYQFAGETLYDARMKLTVLLGAFLLSAPAWTQVQPPKKKLLAIGEVKGFEHDSVSHGLATLEKLGRQTGLWDTYIRTDNELLTKQKLAAGNAKNLTYFDAVIFYTTGDLGLTDQQKADLISFVHDDGKGFLGIHSATDTYYNWPEYGEMVGGYFNEHPWGQVHCTIRTEDKSFPATAQIGR